MSRSRRKQVTLARPSTPTTGDPATENWLSDPSGPDGMGTAGVDYPNSLVSASSIQGNMLNSSWDPTDGAALGPDVPKQIFRQFGGFLLILFYIWTATPEEIRVPWAIAATVLGAALRAWAAGTVLKNEILATTGPYSLVRHPLYLGNILIFVGFNLLNTEAWAWLLTVSFLWFFYPPAIAYEDSKLEELFGQPWRDWRARTPALIPARVKWSALCSEWSIGLSAGRNGELVIFLVISVCLALAIRLGLPF